MIEIGVKTTRIWRKGIEALSKIADEGTFSILRDGIKLRVMDPAHVCMIDFHMKTKAFSEYPFKEPLKMPLDIKHYKTIIHQAKMDEDVALVLGEIDPKAVETRNLFSEQYLKTIISNDDYSRSFTTYLPRDVNDDELSLLSLVYPGRIEINPYIMKRAVKDASMLSDYVAISLDDSGFHLMSNGDLGRFNMDMALDKLPFFERAKGSEAKSMFSLEYILDIMFAATVCDKLEILLGYDIPITFRFTSEELDINFMLAPRIESD